MNHMNQINQLHLLQQSFVSTFSHYYNQIITYLPLLETYKYQHGILNDTFGIEITEKTVLKQYETLFDKYDECFMRNTLIESYEQSMENVLKQMKKLIKSIRLFYKENQCEMEKKMNSLIESMREMEEKLYSKQNGLSLHFIDSLDHQYEKYKSSGNSIEKKELNNEKKVNTTRLSKELKECKNKFFTEKQFHYFQQSIGKEMNQIVFHSERNNWKRKQSEFGSLITKKQSLVFLIEIESDSKTKQFGFYCNNQIDEIGKSIEDENAFLFTAKKELLEFYPILSKKQSIKINTEKEDELFIIGNGDVIIKKEEKKTKCSCKQSSFNYHGKKNVLIGSTGSFEVKTIIVISMKSIEQNINHNQLQSLCLFPNDQQIHKERERKKNERNQRLQIEEWTETTFHKIIFDSRIFSWNRNESVFDKIIYGKDKLVFLMEDENDTTFGCYIHSPITQYAIEDENGNWKGKSIRS